MNQRSKPNSFEMRVVAGLALLLAGSPACSAASASQKVEVFPSLRKHNLHMQQQKQAPAEDKLDDDSIDDVPDVAPVATAGVSSAPLSIPAPMNIGADGFPKLPAVDAMLGGASETMKSISSQASTLQAQIMQVQAQNQAKMTQQKVIFERKLKTQEGKNQQVVSQNNEVASEIQTLKKGNEELRKNCHDLQEGSRVMRVELHTLESKFAEAKEFVGASLTSSDDSKAKELAVLKSPVHHHKSFLDRHDDDQEEDQAQADDKGEKDDDNDDDDSNDDDAESFLAISSHAHRVFAEAEDMEEAPDDAAAVAGPPTDPSGLVDILKSGVAQMQLEEHASEKKMKSIFVANFQQGQKRHTALMSQQKALNGTRTQLQALQLNLHGAEVHLEATKTSLQERLRGLGLFAQRLAHLALAPAGEVSRLLTALPAKVEPAAMPTATGF